MSEPGQVGVGVLILAQIKKVDREFLAPGDVSSIEYHTCDVADRDEEIASGTLVVADVILEEPVTDDARWRNREYPAGYNIEAAIPGSAFPTGGITYMIRIDFFDGEDVVARIQRQYRVDLLYPAEE